MENQKLVLVENLIYPLTKLEASFFESARRK